MTTEEVSEDSAADKIVTEENLEKVQMLLRGREAKTITMPTLETTDKYLRERQKRRCKQAHSKGTRKPPVFTRKNEFLHYVEALDYVKAYNQWKTSFGLIQELREPKETLTTKPKRGKKKPARSIASSIVSKQKITNKDEDVQSNKVSKFE